MKVNSLSDFFSFFWFAPDTFRSYEWENLWALHLLWAVPLLLLIRKFIKILKNPVLDLSIPGKKTMQNVWTYLRLVPTFYYLLSMILLTVALARPQKTNERVEQYTEGIDIMLVLDISESMDLQDFTPNRLEVVKTVAKDFIRGRVGDRIGIVVFAGEAFSLAPLTTDYELLSDLINDITFNMMDAKGTAIGSAIAAGANRMKEDMENSRVMVLLSDGENNAGNVDPIYAAQLASALDIKIHTIAVGKDGMVPYGQDFFGRPQMIESYLDETTLRDIAELGGGQFFRATENDALDRIFDEIDALEKSEIIESRYKETVDFYRVYLFWGLISFFVWLGLKNTFLNNFLMD